jgi:hypothetical protein
VLEQIGSGKGYVDMSTVDAATSTKINEVSIWLLCSYKMPLTLLLV